MTTTTATPATTTARTGGQPGQSQTRVEIFIDGSCIKNPGPGGWGVVLLRKDASDQIVKKTTTSGHELHTTNIRMEMTAACAALEALGAVTSEPVAVFCDANLVPNAMTDLLAKWKAKGWKTAQGEAVKNSDLWERLEAAAGGRNLSWHWVRGHNGTEHNKEADKLAYAAAQKAEVKIRKGTGL